MLKTKPSGPSTMYSGTPCDKCGGPTLGFPSGSIWRPDEDCTPGGHFVVRVAFERAPGRTPRADFAPIKPRPIKPQAPATLKKPSITGFDEFVGSDD